MDPAGRVGIGLTPLGLALPSGSCRGSYTMTTISELYPKTESSTEEKGRTGIQSNKNLLIFVHSAKFILINKMKNILMYMKVLKIPVGKVFSLSRAYIKLTMCIKAL